MAAGCQRQQQQKKERKMWRKEEIDESVRELIHTNPSLAALILVCLLFISWWVAEFVSPAVRFGWLAIAPHLWKAAVAWLTQPVLFILLNLVVLCIWISSSRAAAASSCGNQEHLKSAASLLPSSSSGQPCLAETKKKKKRNLISPDAESLSVEFDDGNSESSALEPQSKDSNICSSPWKAFLEQKTPSGTSYSNQERSEEFESVHAGHEQNNPNSLFSSASDCADSTSRVVLRDVSVSSGSGEASAENGMRDPLVIQKDELNERIEALYAKSREQRRQDSLQRN